MAGLIVVLAGCGGGSTTCSEYFADLQTVIADTTSPEAIQDFLTDTESDLAELLLNSRDSPDIDSCSNALNLAIATIAERGFAQIGD